MTWTQRLAFCGVLMAAQPMLMAQEPWDTSFKLVAARVADQEEAGLGQNQQVGLSLVGAHPVSPRGTFCLEFGYMFSPGNTRRPMKKVEGKPDQVDVDHPISRWVDSRDVYHLGAHYRHQVLTEGLFVQAGLRYTSAVASTVTHMNRSTTWVRDHTPRHGALNPFLGVHARLTDKISVELNTSRVALKNLSGIETKAGQIELALGVHLGK